MSKSQAHDLTSESRVPSGNTDSFRASALQRARREELARIDADLVFKKRLVITNSIIGAMVGMLVGYLGFAISVVDDNIGEFGFTFFRPDALNYLRLSFAYFVPGALLGAAASYVLFTGQSDVKSIIRWVMAGIVIVLGLPLLIGFFLPLTFLMVFDIIMGGLAPGLWISAIVETLLGSFLDGFIYMVSVLYAGVAGGAVYLAASLSCSALWSFDPVPESWQRRAPGTFIYNGIALALTAFPIIILMFAPFAILKSLTALLSGESL